MVVDMMVIDGVQIIVHKNHRVVQLTLAINESR
jgi:hypothetical protein